MQRKYSKINKTLTNIGTILYRNWLRKRVLKRKFFFLYGKNFYTIMSKRTVEPGYNELGLCDISSIPSDIVR